MDNPEECSVCCITYDESERRPRTLPCGHTFCSSCILQLTTANQLTCPDCRASHPATSLDNFPVNYVLEAVVKKLKNVQLAQAAGAAGEMPSVKPAAEKQMSVKTKGGTTQKRPSGMSKKLRSLLGEHESSMRSQVPGCQDTQSQLDQYWTWLTDHKEQLLHMKKKVEEVTHNMSTVVTLIEEEVARVMAMIQEGEEGVKQLEARLECLQNANTAQEAFTAIDHADQCSVEVEDWRQKCQEQFPDVNIVTTSMKVREAIRTALDVLAAETDATHTPALLPHPDPASTIMDKINTITKMPQQITVENLLEMSQHIKTLMEHVHIKTLVEDGLVFAVQEDQDGMRSSRITLENDHQIYMHCLQDQPPPPHAHTLQVSEVVGARDPSSTLVHLDLAWGGSTRGRVHIRLSPNTPAARQFVLLCTGQTGVSYRNTKLHHVRNKGRPGEWVLGGDYEGKGGKGGAGIIDIRGGQYRRSLRAGDVGWVYGDAARAAQFGIITRDWEGVVPFTTVFGEVVSGLEVVRAAANHSDITQVTVVDCGIVLNQ